MEIPICRPDSPERSSTRSIRFAGLNYFREGSGTRAQQGVATTMPGAQPAPNIVGPPGTEPVPSPLQGTIIQILVEEGDAVRQGQQMFVMDS